RTIHYYLVTMNCQMKYRAPSHSLRLMNEADARLNPRQRFAEPAVCVSPALFQFEAAAAQQARNGCGVEFVTVLCMDALAFFKVEAAAKVLHPDGLFVQAFQMHLNAGFAAVPQGHVLERINVKAAAQLAIDPHQHVLVEGGGHALRVVISCVENAGVFDEIKANEQRVARLKRIM